MKKAYLFLFLMIPLLSQAQYAKYGLMEWFTNTYCGICSSRNPALQAVYDQNEQILHRITIHPSVPYQQCTLYGFNKEDNGARQTFYNVGATPTIYLNGVRTSTTASVFADDIANQSAQTSPLAIEVEESGSGSSRSAKITVKVAADLPAGDYRLMVALLEKNLDFNAPNGENKHFDVLRDYISAADGDVFTPPSANSSTTLSYDYNIPSGVSENEAYILAYLQNVETREVLNSGTRFDETTTALTDISIQADLKTFPNPAKSQLNVSVGNEYKIHGLEVFNQVGQQLRQIQLDIPEGYYSLNIDDLPIGAYLLKVDLGAGTTTSRFVKE
jgi:hypothetical protein